MIARGGRITLSKIQNHLLLPMSVLDVIQSTGLAFLTLPIPKGSLCTYGAIGNKITCTIQGFCLQLGFSVPSYNAMLCIYYLCTIKYNMMEEQLARYEPFMHAFAVIPSLAAAILAASFSLFNNLSVFCFVESSDRYLPKEVISHQSKKMIMVYYAVVGFLLLAVVVCICFCMISIFFRSRNGKKNAVSYI